MLARQAVPTALQSRAQAPAGQAALSSWHRAQPFPRLARTPVHSMAVCMGKGWVALAMQPSNNIAGTEEENCGSTQQIKYAKYLHLVERKCSSRVCYLYNFPKQAVELH